MPAFQNITDKTFGRLTALRLVGKNRFGHNLWECQCSCGNLHTVSILQLNKGTQSCGCYAIEVRRRKLIDLTEKQFDRLYVLARGPNTKHGFPKWFCHCDCGNFALVTGNNLRRRIAKSCGCFMVENSTRQATIHGGCYTPEYEIWCGIIKRCYNEKHKNWKDYGGRGISVYQPWRDDFSLFLTHVGQRPTPKHTIDRILPNGNYEPGNVRWATRKEQARNRRDTKYVTFNGETKPLAEWAESIGMSASGLSSRLKKYPVNKALTDPVGTWPLKRASINISG